MKTRPVRTVSIKGKRLPLFKVLDNDGRATHTASDIWSRALPVDGKPGAWVKVDGRRALKMCRHGLHLTANPRYWLGPTWTITRGRRIFLVEYVMPLRKGRSRNVLVAFGEKICVRRARLLREVSLRQAQLLLAKARRA